MWKTTLYICLVLISHMRFNAVCREMTDVEQWQRSSEVMYDITTTTGDQSSHHIHPDHSGSTNRRTCAGCHRVIRERHYLSALDADWHTSCLVCCVCQIPLDFQPTCYVKDSRIYCKQDYFRLYQLVSSIKFVSKVIIKRNFIVIINVCYLFLL